MRCRVLILFVALAVTASCGVSQAADETLWSVDIQGVGGPMYNQLDPPVLMEGVEPAYGYGNIWNGFGVPGHDLPATVNPSMELVDSEGNATSVTFSITGNVCGFSYDDVVPLIQDYLFVNAGNADASVTWAISGLRARGPYELYAYGGIIRDVSITVDTDGDGSLTDETATIVPAGGRLFEGIKASSGGAIIGRAAPGTVTEGNWGGFQLREALLASRPDPPDGAENVLLALVQWKAGGTAQFHDVYFGTDPDALEFKVRNPSMQTVYYYTPGLTPGTTYYWRIDEVEADGTTIHTGNVWSFTAAPLAAYRPNPPDGAEYVADDSVLSWVPGSTAMSHDVYFGTDETAVADGTGGTSKGNQPTTTFDPGILQLGTTYYWRIDEVESNGTTKHRGEVWSFTTLPDIPITDPNLVAWWKLDEGEGTTVLDWSGHGHHGELRGDAQWVAGYDGGALDLDGSGDYVDFGNPTDLPSGTSARSLCGWGKTDRVSAGYRWIAAYGSPALGQAMFIGLNADDLIGGGYMGDDVFVYDFWQVDVWHHVCLTYDGAMARVYVDGIELASEAKDWNLTLSRVHIGRQVNDAAEFWDGLVDDVRIYNKVLTQDEVRQAMRGDPLLAWDPQPGDLSAPDIEHATPLSWSAGDNAAQHDVYVGTDEDAVDDADTLTTGIYRGRQGATSYTPPEALVWGQTYYWRIDEYNTDATITRGRVWSFTVADCLIVDDFEAYNDYCDRIFYAWTDGWGHSGDVACGVAAYGGNGTGSTVGYLGAPFAEQTIVHEGRQSMPCEFDNSAGPYYSETERSFDTPQDWTRKGVKAFTLWYRGLPPSVGSFSYDPATDTYTLTADGSDIWGTSDQFHFAFKQLSGAGAIEAQIPSVSDTHQWAKAGVMIREMLDANSVHAMVVVTPGSGVSLQRRTATGGGSEETTQGGITPPHWVRLERSIGGIFTAYHSPDGSAWTQLGDPVNIGMDSDAFVGLALTSHNTAETCVAEFSNVSITGTVTGQWQSQDIGIASNAIEPLYVAVEDSAGKVQAVPHPDPNATVQDTWQEWNIDLQQFSTVNLASIQKMYLGVGDRISPQAGGAGTLYFDDIRLYKPRCVASVLKPAADLSDNCVVDYADLEIMASEWLGSAVGLAADLDADGDVDLADYAVLAEAWLDELLWPEP